MSGRYTEYDNVTDFIAVRLRNLIRESDRMERHDMAKVLSIALKDYVEGKHDIVFVDGWPHIVKDSVERPEHD